jgi:hypothetical protein
VPRWHSPIVVPSIDIAHLLLLLLLFVMVSVIFVVVVVLKHCGGFVVASVLASQCYSN